MPYEYLEDGVTSDVTFHVHAASLDRLFRDAADAALNLMVESLASIRPETSRALALEAPGLDLLLMKLIDELVFYKDAEGLFLRVAELDVATEGGAHRLRGSLRGEAIDPRRHELAGDVKGTTVHGLRVEPCAEGWQATVTLDV